MDSSLDDEQPAVRDTARAFIRNEVMPLEQMVNRVVDRALQIHGGMGYTRELPFERWYRQVRLFRIFEGTDEMQRLIISHDLLRGHTRIGQFS